MLIPGVNVATFSGQYSTHKYTLLLLVHTAAIQKLQLSLANCDSCDPAGPESGRHAGLDWLPRHALVTKGII